MQVTEIAEQARDMPHRKPDTSRTKTFKWKSRLLSP